MTDRARRSWFAVLALGAQALGALSHGAQAVEGSELTIVVENLRSAEGNVYVALWDAAEGFTKHDAALILSDRPATFGQVRFTFNSLKPGLYAVVSFHDENRNGDLDRTWLGLPDEGLGFSNGARIDLGPPSFEEAAFELKAEHEVVTVRLRY